MGATSDEASSDEAWLDEEENGLGEGEAAANAGKPWLVLIVDDDREVHAITRLVLRSLVFKGRSVDCLSAGSAAEARTILRAQPTIALILLDVVMETDDAGLRLVSFIREDLANAAVRIILRTGQPGQAPEEDVIHDYDINDYKSKTELTSQKLLTATVAALRSYEHIIALEMSRDGLGKIMDASSTLYQQSSMDQFADGVLTQLCAQLGIHEQGILCAQRGDAIGRDRDEIYVLAALGEYRGAVARPLREAVASGVAELVIETMARGTNLYTPDHTALFLKTASDREAVVYLKTGRSLSALDQRLVEMLCCRISACFENFSQFQQLASAQEATLVALADLAEFREGDAGEHVVRVAGLAERIVRALVAAGHFPDAIDEALVRQIGKACMLHDVGKIGTPDRILCRPGPLDPDERAVMEQHTVSGAAILEKAGRRVEGGSYFALGTAVALHHHEWYDGRGYPNGLMGQAIPLAARVAAVADVFDALTHKRPYRGAWPVGEAVAYIRDNAGTQFDPLVVEAFLDTQRESGV